MPSHPATPGTVTGGRASAGPTRDADAAAADGEQDGPVARVRALVVQIDDVVALGPESLREATARAPVDEKPHPRAVSTASSVSFAMTAWA
jgi:hypothetical protein